jgi:hypothetical protein
MTSLNDFLDGEKKIGGLIFRPFTLGSKAACEQMNLSMFTTGNGDLSAGEAERQVIAFAWLHTKPLSDVLKALRENRAWDEAQAFGFELPIESVAEMISEINRISEQAKNNAVEVVEKSIATKDDNEPKNSAGQTR